MAVSEQRLILFALLSAFEADAREIISDHILPDGDIITCIGTEQFDTISNRANSKRGYSDATEADFLNFIDIGDSIKILHANKSSLPNELRKKLKKHSNDFEAIPGIRNRVMHQRPLEFDDFPVVNDLFTLLSTASKQLFHRLDAAISAIRDGRVFAEYAREFSFETRPIILNNLPQPDFDDTGFLGRRAEIDELKKAIFGPYPIVTVLGVGGVGKSALALHAAYDILNGDNHVFDAIIWTSAKTTRLTGSDIQQISDAISTSTGIAIDAVSTIIKADKENPFAQLTYLLSEFRILLFIDNLETILDEKIRAFVKSIPTGSKIVFTSRIGLGAFDYAITIDNLTIKEASIYFRRVSKVWKRADLNNLDNSAISTYCQRLNCSPLGIKWFIQAVAAGASTQRLLSNPSALLDFCLRNIIDKLNDSARSIIYALAITAREQSPASLHFITEVDTAEIEESLRALISSNLIQVIVSKFGEEDRYKISQLAQAYISRNHQPSDSTTNSFTKRQAQLNAYSESASGEQEDSYIFDPNYIRIRREFSGTDAVAAMYLRKALELVRINNFEEAFAKLDKAKHINASYFEVLRVEAFISASSGNTLRANQAYIEAIALSPDYPPLYVAYAKFLLSAFDEPSLAEETLKKALELTSEASEIRIELARCYLYQKKFDDCRETLISVNVDNLKSGRSKTILYDLHAQNYKRSAEHCLNNRDSKRLADVMTKSSDLAVDIPLYAIDNKIIEHFSNTLQIARKFLLHEPETQENAAIQSAIYKIRDCFFSIAIKEKYQANRLTGIVTEIKWDRFFGFLETENGTQYFFHRNSFNRRTDFDFLNENIQLSFSLGQNSEGPCAVSISILESDIYP